MKNYLAATAGSMKKYLHIPLLIFLLIFTVDKIILKLAGILLIYLLHPDFNFRKNFKKIPAFYLLLIGLEAVKFLLFNRDFSKGHTAAFVLGCLFWFISFLCLNQFRSIIDGNDEERIHNTLKVFFLVNCGISFANFLYIAYRSGSPDPFILSDPAYGNSTGDLIKGLFLGPSYLNMMITSFFLFYFLYRRMFAYSLAAMLVILLTSSNFGNIILLPVLLACLVFNKDRLVRLNIASYTVLFPLFYIFASPANFRYVKDSIWEPAQHQKELLAYKKKAAIAEHLDSVVKNDGIAKKDSAVKTKTHTSASQKLEYQPENVNEIIKQMRLDTAPDPHLKLTEKYGKMQSFKETAHYLTTGPKAFLFGAGIGCFSSFLAERMSGVDKSEGSRLFNYMPTYIAPEFYNNHYKIFKSIYDLPKEFRSIKHFPNSFLNQLFGEYGIVGVLLFLLTYVWFFVRHFRRLTYGKYLLFLLGGFLMFDYLFEYLSVVSMFELLMLLDIRKSEETTGGAVPPSLQAKGV